MPIYDYYCKKCKRDVEVLIKIPESILPVHCPYCTRVMKKVPCSKMTFQLIYDPKKHKSSWGSEGYSTTQRNRMKDEAR